MKIIIHSMMIMSAAIMFGCNSTSTDQKKQIAVADSIAAAQLKNPPDTFNYLADRFADIQVLRYEVKGFSDLSLKQKQLAYYLWMAGLSGRDIFYDQKYKHNLMIRKTLEGILETYTGSKEEDNYKKFITYCQRFFFANGIHHHYGSQKMLPEFSFEYFMQLIANSDASRLPIKGMKQYEFGKMLQPWMFDPHVDAKMVDLSKGVDHVKASANNFYEGVTEKEVEKFYADMKKKNPNDKSEMGHNSKLVKENGKIVEKRWKVDGMYTQAIERIVYWLQKATTVAESDQQKKIIELLIKFYNSGDPKDFDNYSIAWVADTTSRIDFTNGFVEVYQDALQKRGSFESIVSMKDMEATKLIAKIAAEAQWFEDHSPIMDQHKKKNVKGISAKVITAIGEVGDAAPATPIGINLPNNEWIREEYGSKSVSIGNVVKSYNYVRSKSSMMDEFGPSKEVIERVKKYGALCADLHTDMHEVIGHASGQLNEGVGSTDKTLKNYAGALEEGRADLVALYYIMDQKLVDLGIMPSLEVGKAQYDSYILNGMMTQLYRIKEGDNIEEAHMRNRQLISAWAFEKGAPEKVIEKVVRDGKTFLVINDYNKLRTIFGQLLREMQRIKSEGDYEAGKNLVENYGVKADQALLKEVHQRYEKLGIAPYMGFLQPKLVPVMSGGEITDVKIEYATDLISQMLDFAKQFSFLPLEN